MLFLLDSEKMSLFLVYLNIRHTNFVESVDFTTLLSTMIVVNLTYTGILGSVESTVNISVLMQGERRVTLKVELG